MTSAKRRALLLRANRDLGAALVDANLVKVAKLATATERLLELAAAGPARQATLLGVLAYELKAVTEEDALLHLAEEQGAGLVDLRECDVTDEVKASLDLDACWATWSLPFDREEGFTYVATAHGLSETVRHHWEKQCDGPVLWFGATLDGIADMLEKIEAARITAKSAENNAP
ncbi:MAG: hypothetical protein WCL04_08455 [Verrucomicrobiota bacterium]